MDLQNLIKTTIIFTTLLLTTLYSIIKFLSDKKQKGLKFEGVEKLALEIARLENEKIQEQLKIIKERCNILYSEFVNVFCKHMEVTTDSKQARSYEAFILRELRIMTDQIMEDVIYRNNLANRFEKRWEDYKRCKLAFILSEVLKFIPKIWNEEFIEFSYEETVKRCRKDNVELYYKHVNEMFEDIREISLTYKKSIKNKENLIIRLKEGKLTKEQRENI